MRLNFRKTPTSSGRYLFLPKKPFPNEEADVKVTKRASGQSTDHAGVEKPPLVERVLAGFAERVSRRSLITKCSGFLLGLLGVTLIPELPLDRRVSVVHAQAPCTAWFLCGIYGYVCGNCAGTLDCSGSGSGSWSQCCYYQPEEYWMINYTDCCGNDCPGECGYFFDRGSSQPAWCSSGSYCCTNASVVSGC